MRLKRNDPIHDTLTGYDFTEDPPLTRAEAIRKKCLECQGLSPILVKECESADCTLWPFRLGRGVCVDPLGIEVHTKAVTESQRECGRQLHLHVEQ